MRKARDNFEYKISQTTRKAKDYVDYIKFERNTFARVKERIKELKITSNPTILTLIADKMKTIYSQALSRPPTSGNVRFWNEYIIYLKNFKYLKDISPTYERMLQVCFRKLTSKERRM